jgi:DNA-binding beta-propeller fold protein YncE
MRTYSALAIACVTVSFVDSWAIADVPHLYGTRAGDGTVEVVSQGQVATFAVAPPPSPHYLEGLAVDHSGTLFVSDWGNNSIFKVAADGTATTFATGVFNPHDMAFDSFGNLYVATDDGGGSIVKFDPSGSRSLYRGGLNYPHYVAVDGSNNIYFANEGDTSLHKLSPDGTLSSFGSGLSEPGALVVDSESNLLVGNHGHGNGFITKFSASGTLIGATSGLVGLWPTLAIDPYDNLYFNYGGGVSRLTPDGDLSLVAPTVNYYDMVFVPEVSGTVLSGVPVVMFLLRRRQPRRTA